MFSYRLDAHFNFMAPYQKINLGLLKNGWKVGVSS